MLPVKPRGTEIGLSRGPFDRVPTENGMRLEILGGGVNDIDVRLDCIRWILRMRYGIWGRKVRYLISFARIW
jgi:hypothetical protein